VSAATRIYLLLLQVASAAAGIWVGVRLFDAVAR
jgi:hypothetical protein